MNRTTFRTGMVASVAAVILVGAGVGAYAVSRSAQGDDATRPAAIDEASGDATTVPGGDALTVPDGTGIAPDDAAPDGDGHRAGPPSGDGPAMLPPEEGRTRGERPERDDEGFGPRGDDGFGAGDDDARPDDADDDSTGTPELAQPNA